MTTPADLLWRINNEYQKRLSHAQKYLSLLEQLLVMQERDGPTLLLLRHALERVSALLEEHRTWRYTYYYESLDTRRMVQSNRAIQQAITHFSRMRARHEQDLQSLYALLEPVQRPDPALTRVPTGDLWMLTAFALNDLDRFDEYLHSLRVQSS